MLETPSTGNLISQATSLRLSAAKCVCGKRIRLQLLWHTSQPQQYRGVVIRESVDSLYRDGTDTPMPPYIGKAFTRTNFEDLSLFMYMIMVCE